MRKLFILSLLLCINMVRSYGDELVWTEINVTALDEGSAVQNAIAAKNLELEGVENLRISGTINGYDFNILRNKMPNLRNLDMTNVDIVANDYEYTTDHHSEDNVIGGYAFESKKSLESVYLPKSITHLGENAFSRCSNLKNVYFPSGVKVIGTNAFFSCGNLENVVLPPTLKTISYCSFIGTGLKEIRIPSSVEIIANDAFTVGNIKDVYVYTIEPTVYQSNSVYAADYSDATLHVPSTSYDKYYWASGWNQFPTIVAFDEPYEYFYLNNDYTLDDGRIDGTPDADINPGGGLIVEGDGDQDLDDLHIHEGDESGGSVIGDGNIDVNNLFIDIEIKKNKWYYFCFPYRIALVDIQFSCEASWTFRQYDGEERANNGYGGWKHMPEATEYLTANQGYIFRCSENGTLQIPVEKPQGGYFAGGNREQTMANYTSASAENASWNFIGNPYTCYYDIDDMQNGTNGYTGPIIVWDVENQTYETVRPGDDEYFLRPFEAYFVQKPEGQDAMGFEANSRTTYQQSEKLKEQKQQARRLARANSPRTRQLVNLVLTDGQTTDKTRVVYNEKCSKDYEIGTDAAKFMSSGKPQLYTLDQRQVQYAINERPAGEVPLGYTATKAGELTISAPRMDKKVCLRDNVTGTTHDLQNGGYTFQTEAGTFNARFTIVADNSTTDIDVTKADGQTTPTVYTLDGKQVPEPQKGQVNIIDKKKVIK